MPTAVESKVSSPQAKAGLEKTQSYLTLTSTLIGVLGGLGTIFVWLAANFYVGEIEIIPERPVEAVVTKIFNKEGHESTFHTRSIKLMPGEYHLEVGIAEADARSQHYDVVVAFGQKNTINLAVPPSLAKKEFSTEKVRKRWWQFWKKGPDTHAQGS